MITQKEFLEIVEKHLKIRDDGSIFINEPSLGEAYSEYLKNFAAKVGHNKFLDNGCGVEVNIKNCK